MENLFAQRLENLRGMMRSHGWDAVIFTGSDPHNSEYPAERWKQVRWLTGFTGECGDVVVTLDHAGLWTDTRYFIQADSQLAGTGVELHKMRVPGQVSIPDWLPLKFDGGNEVFIAVDGLCIGAGMVREIIDKLAAAGVQCNVVSVPDLLSALWTDRPSVPQTPIFTVDPGEDRQSKIARLRGWMGEKGADWCLVSALDEIAWLLNARASDIEYNPLVISWLLVGRESVDWFVLKDDTDDGISEKAFDEVGADGVELHPYADIEEALMDLDGTVALDSGRLNWHLYNISAKGSILDCQNPVAWWKAVKNPTEIAGMRAAHVQDGVAMEKFIWWLEKCMENEKRISEWDAAVKLGQLRAEIPEYRGDSFETICAYGPGAALPHYITPSVDAPVLEPHGLFLCDSGGQYCGERFCGTTDITRTTPLGPCTPLEMEDYTLVLKSHIDLAMAVFPKDMATCRLDAFAHMPLWRSKRDFGHGTGHGVGYFLGVHEAPPDFRQNMDGRPLKAGLIHSDEPGIYREGMHGVRHESLLLCKDAGTNEFGSWLCYENITLCHIDTSIVVKELMSADELAWLNAYNAHVYAVLAPLLPAQVAEWLRGKTEAVQ